MKLKVKKLHPEAIIPKYATEGAACFDLHALLPDSRITVEEKTIGHKAAIVRTGLSFEVPEGFAMMIYSRSGHGFNHGVTKSLVLF